MIWPINAAITSATTKITIKKAWGAIKGINEWKPGAKRLTVFYTFTSAWEELINVFIDMFYLLSKKAWIHPRNDKNTDWIYWKWIISCQNFVDRISGNRSISKATEGSLPSRRGGKVLKAEFSDWGSAIKWSSHWASCFLLVAMPHNRPSLATNRGNFFQSKNMFFRSKVLPPTKMLPANKMLP